MNITIQRPPITGEIRTISKIYIDKEYFSECLEDQDRGIYQADTLQYIMTIKEKHATAIPYGTYQVVMSYSNKFKKYLPELLDVPGFSGIRIHAGNTEADTSGCLLPGKRQGNKVSQSVLTTTKLISLISKRIKKEKVFVSILPYNNITIETSKAT